MPSERIQRRIDAFLDQAEAASDRQDWAALAGAARAVLAIDEVNEDAAAFLKMAEANLGTPARTPTLAPEAPSPAPSLPESFAAGRYHVRRFLGEGGKKRVFLAHDQLLDRDVAFALIKTEGLDEMGRERITREAQAMGRLGAHPHVVSIYDIGEEGGAPFVVTELMAGGDVESLLGQAEGPLPLARTLEIAKGVARGLAFAHARCHATDEAVALAELLVRKEWPLHKGHGGQQFVRRAGAVLGAPADLRPPLALPGQLLRGDDFVPASPLGVQRHRSAEPVVEGPRFQPEGLATPSARERAGLCESPQFCFGLTRPRNW